MASDGTGDFDNDGDMDVYFPQGHTLGRDGAARAPSPGADLSAQRGRLYRNDLIVDGDGVPVLRFTDVTEASGIVAGEYGMGVAAGDVDNDGWVDLYLTNFGPSQMWRNNGNGTFTDVTRIVRAEEALVKERAFLDALLAYWGTVNDLVQPQEHGGQREGEALDVVRLASGGPPGRGGDVRDRRPR